MDFYVTDHMSNAQMRAEMKVCDGGEAKAVARMLSRIAGYDERRLYLEDGYPSMRAYLMSELKYSEQEASKRIWAARTARKFPVLFIALADGRLNLTGLNLLNRHLTPRNLDELLAVASHKTIEEIERLIAERFPRPDLPELLVTIAPPAMPPIAPPCVPEHSARNVEVPFLNIPSYMAEIPAASPAPIPTPEHSARNVPASLPQGKMTRLAPDRTGFQFTGDTETCELYEDVRALLSHEIPSGKMALVFKEVLQIAKAHLEKRKYAKTDRPGRSRGSVDPRHIPAEDKRKVLVRDGGKCTFVSDTGKRCESRYQLEFHHNDEFARGGPSTAKNLRLLCGPHHRRETERSFGAEFMERKREEAKQRSCERATSRENAMKVRTCAPLGNSASAAP